MIVSENSIFIHDLHVKLRWCLGRDGCEIAMQAADMNQVQLKPKSFVSPQEKFHVLLLTRGTLEGILVVEGQI